MKAVQSLMAVMLSGTLSGALLVVARSDPAAAKQHHHISGEDSNGSKSSDGGKSGGTPAGGVRNSSTGNASGSANANTSPSDKNGNNASGPTTDGPMKKGDERPGKSGSQQSGTADPGKNQLIDHEVDRNAVHPGNINGADAGKSDIIADGPGHKTAKPADTTKKTTTIFRPHMVRDHRRPSVQGKMERNAIGVAIPNDGNPKLGLEPKVTDKADGARTGLPGLVTTTTIPNAAMPLARRPGNNNAVEVAPKTGPIVNGTSVSRPGSNLTSVGGPSKNIVGALSGSSFKPRHP
jgi:hypothetical protein